MDLEELQKKKKMNTYLMEEPGGIQAREGFEVVHVPLLDAIMVHPFITVVGTSFLTVREVKRFER